MASPKVRTREAPALDPDARAREIEQQMTDEERFSLVISLSGAPIARDERYLPTFPRALGTRPVCRGSACRRYSARMPAWA